VKLFKAALLATIVLAAVALAAMLYMDSPANPEGAARRFTISRGETAGSIAGNLRSSGFIRSPFYFKLVVASSGKSGKLKSGVFEISPAMTTRRIVELLTTSTGLQRATRITVPEGFTARQIAERLQEDGICAEADFMRIAEAPAENGIDTRGHRLDSLEGFLFPETYFLDANSTCKKVAQRMVDHFFSIYSDEFRHQAGRLGMTMNQVVTLASLIEREARIAAERALISGVLHNRLKAGMLLQVDATIQYALPNHREKLYYKHLEIDSPYNTYKNKGLPPGPICNPGKSSIHAALFPENTDFYYYVARGDGSHIFSSSNEEHVRAKQRVKRENRDSR